MSFQLFNGVNIPNKIYLFYIIMYSYGHFRPGGSKDTSRIIKYIDEYNKIYGNQGKINTCYCISNKYDKNLPGSDSVSAKISNATRIAQVINSKKGGSTQFGNFYLAQPLNVNYLGRIEGMPGGSGMPPINRF
jgi:hypothetical protein